MPPWLSALNRVKNEIKAGLSFNGAKPAFMVAKPKKTRPKPRSTSPTYIHFRRPRKNFRRTPAAIAGKAYSVILKAINWAVTVVPILAPSMTPMACVSVIKPASTKLTSITVAALELWITLVTMAPTPQPTKRLLDTIARIWRIFLPATF